VVAITTRGERIPTGTATQPVRQVGARRTLAAEHALLLAQVAHRVNAVRAAAARGVWPAREIDELLDYFQAEVLRQAADEEWWAFPTSPAVARLCRDHDRLRVAADVLARVASGEDRRSPSRAAAIARAILTQLRHHVVAEEKVLALIGLPKAGSRAGAVARYPHDWYEVTRGPVVDVDALPGDRATDAITQRLLRLRPGEGLELRSAAELGEVWRRMSRLDPGGYGFAYLHEGPDEWVMVVTRRRQCA
jgi:hypothetical protein